MINKINIESAIKILRKEISDNLHLTGTWDYQQLCQAIGYLQVMLKFMKDENGK